MNVIQLCLHKVHTPCPKSTFSAYCRRVRFTDILEINEVPIGMNGVVVDSHTYTELCGNEALEHQMRISPHMKIVPNKCLIYSYLSNAY